MKNIFLLTKIEFKKILKNKLAYFGFFSIAIIMLFLIIGEFNDMRIYNNNSAYRDEVMSWQEREQNLIKYATESLEEDTIYNEIQREQIRRRIALAQYRLDNNIPRNITKNVWWFFNDNSFDWMVRLSVLLIAFIGSFNIGGEYSDKTLKQMLILPYKRYKIIISKIIALTCYGLLLFLIMFIMGLASGFIIHGTNGLTDKIALYYKDYITTMSMSLYSIILVLLKVVEIIFSISIIVFISILTKNSAISAIVGSFFAIAGAPISNFLGQYYKVFYYTPFANLDFRRYLDFGNTMPAMETGFSSVIVQGITPLMSACIVGITIAVLIAVSIRVFQKQDI